MSVPEESFFIWAVSGKELLPDTLADPAVEAVSETGSATVSVDEPSVFVLPDAGGTGVDAGNAVSSFGKTSKEGWK